MVARKQLRHPLAYAIDARVADGADGRMARILRIQNEYRDGRSHNAQAILHRVRMYDGVSLLHCLLHGSDGALEILSRAADEHLDVAAHYFAGKASLRAAAHAVRHTIDASPVIDEDMVLIVRPHKTLLADSGGSSGQTQGCIFRFLLLLTPKSKKYHTFLSALRCRNSAHIISKSPSGCIPSGERPDGLFTTARKNGKIRHAAKN